MAAPNANETKNAWTRLCCCGAMYGVLAVVFLFIAVVTLAYQSEITSYDAITEWEPGKWHKMYIGAFVLFGVLLLAFLLHCNVLKDEGQSQEQINKGLSKMRIGLIICFLGIVAGSVFFFSYVKAFSGLTRCPNNSTELEVKRQHGDEDVDKCVTYTHYVLAVWFMLSLSLIYVMFINSACDRLPSQDKIWLDSHKIPERKVQPVKSNQNANAKENKPKAKKKPNDPKQNDASTSRTTSYQDLRQIGKQRSGKKKSTSGAKYDDLSLKTLNPLNIELQQTNAVLLAENETLKRKIELLQQNISQNQYQSSAGIPTTYHVESEFDTRPTLTIPLPPTYKPLHDVHGNALSSVIPRPQGDAPSSVAPPPQGDALPSVAPPPYSKSHESVG